MIVAGKLITKEKRQEMFGVVAGGSGSSRPEEYQRSKVIEITGLACPKTNTRINLQIDELKDVLRPNVHENGFDYSENFDGFQTINGKLIYLNFKCIVGCGGGQTRSLREVYWFINGQLNILAKTENIYFANILDGDHCDSNMDKFEYLKSLHSEELRSKVYVGDLVGYLDWFIKLRDETQ